MTKSISVSTVAAQQEQSQASKKATLDLLRSKRRRSKTISLDINGQQAEFVFNALSAAELDKLQAKFPPSAEQKLKGMAWNADTFPPALVAACLSEPEVSYEEMVEIFSSGEWSTGELSTLFNTATALCMEGMDIPFSVSD